MKVLGRKGRREKGQNWAPPNGLAPLSHTQTLFRTGGLFWGVGGGTLAACSHLPLESGFSVMIRAAADIPASFCLRKMHVYDYIPHLTPNPLQLLWSQVLKLGTGPDRRIVVLEFGEPESGLLV